MSMMKYIRRLLYFGTGWLYEYELEALISFYQRLSDVNKKRLKEQIKRFTIVQRQVDKKTLVFYDLDDVEQKHWPEEILFSERDQYLIYDKFSLTFQESGIKCKVAANLQDGYFFGLKLSVSSDSFKEYVDLCKKVNFSSVLTRLK